MEAKAIHEHKTSHKPHRLKVLMAAYTCTPGLPSEPGVGWNNIVQVAQHHDVWAITSEGNRQSIEEEIAINPLPNVTWIYITLPAWMSWYLTGEKGGRVHYYLYQIAAYQAAKTLQNTISFDIVHHINYVSYWTPVFLSRLEAPFIWGPVGGAESAPRNFYKTLNARGMLFELVRDAVRWFAHHVDPFVRETAQNATLSLATTYESAGKMHELGADPVEILPAICMTEADIERLLNIPLPTDNDRPIHFLSIGRFIGWKGYHLSIDAFALFHASHPDSKYTLIGRGPQEYALKEQVSRLGIEDAVNFTGFIPHQEVMEYLAESDVLVHPSLHDSGGVTCLEAMTAARPVLCIGLGGPALIVNDDTGIVINASSPEQVIIDMAEAMKYLTDNPLNRRKMGLEGRQNILENYTWQQRGDYISSIYWSIHAEQTLSKLPS